MDDLEEFIPKSVTLKVAGMDFVITPLKIGQLPAFAAAITPAYGYIEQDKFIEAVLHQYDAVRDAAAIAVGQPKEWLDDLAPDDFVELSTAIYEINLDFFARRLLPLLQQSAIRIATAAAQMPKLTGETSSPGSSSGDTASTAAST